MGVLLFYYRMQGLPPLTIALKGNFLQPFEYYTYINFFINQKKHVWQGDSVVIIKEKVIQRINSELTSKSESRK